MAVPVAGAYKEESACMPNTAAPNAAIDTMTANEFHLGSPVLRMRAPADGKRWLF